jgi:hypothetical protein
MLRANEFPADHPAMTMALTPDQVADLLVDAIDAERFLVLSHPELGNSLADKAADYDAWIDGMSPRA